jgi:hypothetical protein
LRSSATPESTAENDMKWALELRVSILASVVLPEPGEPQKIRLGSLPLS